MVYYEMALNRKDLEQWQRKMHKFWIGVVVFYCFFESGIIGQLSPVFGPSFIDHNPRQQNDQDMRTRADAEKRAHADVGPLYKYGNEARDVKLVGKAAQTGHMVDMVTFFPYYGAKYNYSIISVHGYITFGELLDDGLDFVMGEEVSNWPENPDPATIAVYTCRQREATSLHPYQRGVYYRLVLRKDMINSVPVTRLRNSHVVIDETKDSFLTELENDLKAGMVGAQNFRAAAALVVTWENVTFYQASKDDEDIKRASYQAVFMTDRDSRLSYVILNYHALGFSGADIFGQSKRGRCKAQFNGGNQTGVVQVDPVHSKQPIQLAMHSAVPHVEKGRGRYLFRVDDIVKRGGCSNLTSGTYRMTIYPDIVSSMGDVSVQLNGPCLKKTDAPILHISEYMPAKCTVKNASIAECKMVQNFHWGTKNVYLQVGQNKAYVGSVYYVPPGLDPFQLQIIESTSWFSRTRPSLHRIQWHRGNFTLANGKYANNLVLALYGYKEIKEERDKKFIPQLKKIAILDRSVNNPNGGVGRYYSSEGKYNLTRDKTPEWIGNGEWELWTYRFGFLKLYIEDKTQPNEEGAGIWSPPIPLHFWWGREEGMVERVAAEKCLEWYKEDGHQWNFIMDTETNSSCPCRLEQAQLDIGRYMPHPRCSLMMRNLGCDAYTGARDCFLSAQNVQGHYVTHYGQVCCYDRDGYLMQTSYQSVVQMENYPYSPGFPQRAYEFGTYPFIKQFEIPVLSNYYHDVMPYFFCCKWAREHCQFFYWRRPSSGCQNYQAPGVATVMGTGHFITVDGSRYIFNIPGIYVLLHKPQLRSWHDQYQHQMYPESPQVQIQIRMERYPNRMVDFSHQDVPQAKLVQPLNVSVVTGVAMQEGSSKETDRVVITLRKDTRRLKYRLNVLVNDELRYFDNIWRQKYRGVMVYINDLKEGQSEVYVALERSRIGIRVRESYAVEIVRQMQFEESYGLLDVLVSIPPEYKMTPSQHPSNEPSKWDIALAGLVGTFTGNAEDDFLDGKTRRTTGTSGRSNNIVDNFARTWIVDGTKFPNLFNLLSQDHQTWPEASFLGPVYPYALSLGSEHNRHAQHDDEFNRTYDNCGKITNNPPCLEFSVMLDINQTCLESWSCKYEYFLTRQRVLAVQLKQEIGLYYDSRSTGTRKYNSCGAINVEYPEYLVIDPPTGKLYLEGDTVHFDCSQDHWVKGNSIFKCHKDGWTKGSQPWCRSKRLENTQKILAILFGILCFIMLLLGVFVCCFCVRKSRQAGGKIVYRTEEPLLASHETRRSLDSKQGQVSSSIALTSKGSPTSSGLDVEPQKKSLVAEASLDGSPRSVFGSVGRRRTKGHSPNVAIGKKTSV